MRLKDLDGILGDDLRAPEFIGAYLEDALEDEDERVFLMAVRDVVRAHLGVAGVAEKTGLGRESLYKTLSEEGNPRLHTLRLILGALGLRLSVVRAEAKPQGTVPALSESA